MNPEYQQKIKEELKKHVCCSMCQRHLLELYLFKPSGKWKYTTNIVEFITHWRPEGNSYTPIGVWSEQIEELFKNMIHLPGYMGSWEDANKEYNIVLMGGPFPMMWPCRNPDMRTCNTCEEEYQKDQTIKTKDRFMCFKCLYKEMSGKNEQYFKQPGGL